MYRGVYLPILCSSGRDSTPPLAARALPGAHLGSFRAGGGFRFKDYAPALQADATPVSGIFTSVSKLPTVKIPLAGAALAPLAQSFQLLNRLTSQFIAQHSDRVTFIRNPARSVCAFFSRGLHLPIHITPPIRSRDINLHLCSVQLALFFACARPFPIHITPLIRSCDIN